MNIKKYDIVLVVLNPTGGSEQQGTRPCVILQNNIANTSKLNTYTIAPITSNIRKVPAGIYIESSKENNLKNDSKIELSQIRTIDQSRIIKKLGSVEEQYYDEIREKLILFFDVYDEF